MRLAVLFIVAMYTGMRRDELLGLAWSEIDLDQGAAFARETASGDGPKSEAGIRVVPLSPTAVAALRAWRKVQAADQLAWGPDWPGADRVFTREDGTEVPGQWTSTRFEILAYRAGVPPVRFHDLRHGTASLLKAAGVDTKIISTILGHARSDFTDRQYSPRLRARGARLACSAGGFLRASAGGRLASSRRVRPTRTAP